MAARGWFCVDFLGERRRSFVRFSVVLLTPAFLVAGIARLGTPNLPAASYHALLCMLLFPRRVKGFEITRVLTLSVIGCVLAVLLGAGINGPINFLSPAFSGHIATSAAIEEIVFRWWLPRWLEQTASRSRANSIAAATIPAIAFALAHIPTRGLTPSILLFAAAGLVLQVLATIAGLWLPVCAHVSLNLRAEAALPPFLGNWWWILGVAAGVSIWLEKRRSP
jgi:membrane protease YdiL (CAAX protease family)